MNWEQDQHGDWHSRFVFPGKTEEFSIDVDRISDMDVINPFDFFVEPMPGIDRSSFRLNCNKSSGPM